LRRIEKRICLSKKITAAHTESTEKKEKIAKARR
jgi:hypothetical protein